MIEAGLSGYIYNTINNFGFFPVTLSMYSENEALKILNKHDVVDLPLLVG